MRRSLPIENIAKYPPPPSPAETPLSFALFFGVRSKDIQVYCRLDFRRSLVSGLRSGEERGLLSRTAAGDRG